MSRTTGPAILALWLLATSQPIAASSLSPEEFADGFTVTGEGSGGLWQVELPEAVYDSVVRSDLGDLRVFDAGGRLVPHALLPPEPVAQEAPAPVELSFFPLRGGAERPAERRLVIDRDAEGRVAAVRAESGATGERRVTAWLVVAAALRRPADRLVLEWRGAPGGDPRGTGGFAVTVDVEAGDDLARWRRVVDGAGLADLEAGGARLKQQAIELPPLQAPYLLVEWPEELDDVTVTAVRAEFDPDHSAPAPLWLRLSGEPDAAEPPGILYRARGLRPFDRARLDLSGGSEVEGSGDGPGNGVLRGVLLSRPNPEAEWRRRHAGLFYSLERGGTRLRSSAARFPETADPEWRLVAEEPGRAEALAPVLELGWRPHRLAFVAEGEPPYTVAFGSGAVEPAARPVEELVGALDDEDRRRVAVDARAAEVRTLGGEERLEPPPTPLPWRTILLWAILLAGVALLIFMVRALFRQMS